MDQARREAMFRVSAALAATALYGCSGGSDPGPGETASEGGRGGSGANAPRSNSTELDVQPTTGSSEPAPTPAGSDNGVYLDEEFAGPYNGWRNIKTLHGAAGDGVADDTTAFQNALNALANDNSVCPVLYIPAGVYRITSTLTRIQRRGLTILGEDPATTTILWEGGANTMFAFQGCQHMRFGRLTLDGKGTSTRLLHIWKQTGDGAGYYFPTRFILEDIHFKDAQIGLALARHSMSTANSHGGTAELNIKRCKFTGHAATAVQITDFNTLDVNFHRCLFDGNAIGITNTIGYPNTGQGAGGWQVWDTEFQNHSGPAMKVSTASQFYFYNCRSRSNAGGLLTATSVSAPCQVWMQGCFDDGTAADTVDVGNYGTLALIDNRFQRKGRAVRMSQPNSRLVAVGNRVGDTGAWLNTIGTRNHEQDTLVFDAAPEKLLFTFAPRVFRTVFEVSSVSAANVQSAINAAVAAGNRAKVHIPYGMHNIAPGVIVVPKDTDIEIVGDGSTLWDNGTFLMAASPSASPVIQLERPTKATLRGLGIDGQGWAPGLLSDHGIIDTQQAGGRITMEFCQVNQPQSGGTAGFVIDAGSKVDLVQLIAGFSEGGGSGVTFEPAFDITGPVKFNQWGTLTINHANGYKINDADVIVAGFWYESSPVPFTDFTEIAPSGSTGSGTFSVVGGALATTGGTLIDVSRFDGDVLLGCLYTSGDITGTASPGLRCLALGVDTGHNGETFNFGGGATLATVQCQQSIYEANTPIANANVNPALVTEVLSNVRSQSIEPLSVTAGQDVTDLRLHDVWVTQAAKYSFKLAA